MQYFNVKCTALVISLSKWHLPHKAIRRTIRYKTMHANCKMKCLQLVSEQSFLLLMSSVQIIIYGYKPLTVWLRHLLC